MPEQADPSQMPGWTPPDYRFARQPPKGGLVNLETGEQLEFQFNPETFTEKIGVNYAKHIVPGFGGQILQYINTTNETIPLVIYVSRIAALEEAAEAVQSDTMAVSGAFGVVSPPEELGRYRAAVEITKKFLQSLLYPVKTVSGGWKAPPRVLFVWPEVVRLVCVVTSLNFNHQRFSILSLATTALTAELTLEELRTTQKFSDDVRRHGTLSNVQHLRKKRVR